MRPSSWTMVLAVVVVLLVGRIGYQHLASAAQPCDCHCESAQALVAARDVAPHEQLLQQQQYTQLLTQQLQQQKTLLEQLQLQLAKQQQNSNNNNNIVAAAPAAVAPAAAAPAAALPRCGTGKAERRILNSLKRTNHRFGMAGAPPEVLVFDPETLVYAPGKRLHPDYHVVIDVGAYDGSDWAFVPHGLGYSVVSFELSPENWGKWTQKAASQGLSEGNQYTTVTFASADAVGKPTPQSSHLQIPTKDATPHVFFVKAGASDKNIGVSVNSGDVMAQVHAAGGGGASNTMVVRIDDLVPPSTRVFAMKIDTQVGVPWICKLFSSWYPSCNHLEAVNASFCYHRTQDPQQHNHPNILA